MTVKPLSNQLTFMCTADKQNRHHPQESNSLHSSERFIERSPSFWEHGDVFDYSANASRLICRYEVCLGSFRGDTFRDHSEQFEICDLLKSKAWSFQNVILSEMEPST